MSSYQEGARKPKGARLGCAACWAGMQLSSKGDTLQYRKLGSSTLEVSVVGLGANNFGSRLDAQQTSKVVDAALDAGVNFIDTADIYGNKGGSEVAIGKAIGGRRESFVLATKFGMDMVNEYPSDIPRASPKYMRMAVEGSLSRLNTDYIDLYQLHEPDGITPIEETLGEMTLLVEEGKVRFVGSSNFASWQVVEADEVAKTTGSVRFESSQNHYSLLQRHIESELAGVCVERKIGILPYFPLANGILTGKWKRGDPPPEGSRLSEAWARSYATPEAFDVVEKLEAFASERSISILSVAVGGLAAQPGVASVIAGATSAEQIKANAQAGEWVPTESDLVELDKITLSHRKNSNPLAT